MLDWIFLTVHGWMNSGATMAAVGCFAWGVISVLFSPCHMASIPLVVSYVGGQNHLLRGKQAARYAVIFTTGLYITIALVGLVCALLGRMLGEIGPYWTVFVGVILIWVALDMLGVSACSMSGGMLGRFQLKGLRGAFVLGLAYGLMSGSCTFGFIAPILAFITIQDQIALGLLYIGLFGIGHCLPIAAAGSSTVWVRRLLENGGFQKGSFWFRKAAGVAIGLFGIYFILRPFIDV
ncbi:MAG: cytochrome c biogenesis CcdA family protein [Desulfobacterales bacterium]